MGPYYTHFKIDRDFQNCVFQRKTFQKAEQAKEIKDGPSAIIRKFCMTWDSETNAQTPLLKKKKGYQDCGAAIQSRVSKRAGAMHTSSHSALCANRYFDICWSANHTSCSSVGHRGRSSTTMMQKIPKHGRLKPGTGSCKNHENIIFR